MKLLHQFQFPIAWLGILAFALLLGGCENDDAQSGAASPSLDQWIHQLEEESKQPSFDDRKRRALELAYELYIIRMELDGLANDPGDKSEPIVPQELETKADIAASIPEPQSDSAPIVIGPDKKLQQTEKIETTSLDSEGANSVGAPAGKAPAIANPEGENDEVTLEGEGFAPSFTETFLETPMVWNNKHKIWISTVEVDKLRGADKMKSANICRLFASSARARRFIPRKWVFKSKEGSAYVIACWEDFDPELIEFPAPLENRAVSAALKTPVEEPENDGPPPHHTAADAELVAPTPDEESKAPAPETETVAPGSDSKPEPIVATVVKVESGSSQVPEEIKINLKNPTSPVPDSDLPTQAKPDVAANQESEKPQTLEPPAGNSFKRTKGVSDRLTEMVWNGSDRYISSKSVLFPSE
jgi:hypothetical protein